EAQVQFVEDGFQVVDPALGASQVLASAHAAQQVRLFGDLAPAEVLPVAQRVAGINRLPIELGEENVCYGVQHRLRRPLEQIGKAHGYFAVAQPDGVVDVGEREEPEGDLRHRSAGTELAVGAVQQGNDVRGSAVCRFQFPGLKVCDLSLSRVARSGKSVNSNQRKQVAGSF